MYGNTLARGTEVLDAGYYCFPYSSFPRYQFIRQHEMWMNTWTNWEQPLPSRDRKQTPRVLGKHAIHTITETFEESKYHLGKNKGSEEEYVLVNIIHVL